eukprot:Plantae.Rhodophyta-Hildenbrandia_rubra.ctg3195.p1 GENE.Plantae.Rhodophyta-Hildenbrandia_rubra.ctg3195~~Plantae.Rhodophyta-Hildenbrandia_rubra.ctg3195.p1  ORF type:complete len:182 (-),score=38.00 Plantae.Rhodophyta-Hildenbrandia_rubra.ctg3195:1420-1965(-)
MDFNFAETFGIVKPSRSSRNDSPTPKSEETAVLVKQIQRSMGGQGALRGITSPAVVRSIVLEALATLQQTDDDQIRVRSNKLTSIERAAVRIVTNRGAAMRSRQRQRRFVGDLMMELEMKQGVIKKLEGELESLRSIMMLMKWETEKHGINFPYFDFDQAAVDFGAGADSSGKISTSTTSA